MRMLKLTILIFVLIFTLAPIFAKALLLYKGSEQGYGYSILLRYVAPELRNLSVVYDIVDVESEVFTTLDLANYELIISCYYSPTMPGAKNYLKRLYDFILSGGKIFIMNNIGATIDSSGSNHPGLAEVNSVYNLIGLSYSFGWKKVKPSEVVIDSYYLNTQNLVYESNRDVEPYTAISPNTKAIVTVKTKDGTLYDMAFVSPLGAVISYSYLFDDFGKVAIDIAKILVYLIYGNSDNFRILVVGKDNSVLSKALDYTLWQYDWKDNIPSVLSSYDSIILFDASLPISDSRISNYVLSGGTLVVISKGNKQSLVNTLKIPSKIYPVPPNFELQLNKTVTYSEMLPSSEPLIVSSDNQVLSWKVKMGSGQIIYYPADLLTKPLRGLFIQIMLSQLPISIQPIINSYTIFLDDFPLPAYNRKIEVIKREFGDITDNDFYYNVWWPTMKKISKEFGLKYTAIFVPNYNASVTWPFSFQEYANTPQQKLVLKELLTTNVEIGLHGYNHIPLTKDRWKEDDLKNVLKTLKIFLKNTLGENYIPYTYVAPDNIIDEFGIQKLLENFPTIKLIGTTYKGTDTPSEFTVVKEGTVIVPRTTSGYYPVSKLVTDSVLSLMMLGTFQYFLHPDDLFSKDRNPEERTWSDMSASLIEFFDTMKKYYPYLRNHYSSESAEIIYDFLTQKPLIRKQKEKIVVELSMGYHLPRYYYLRIDRPFTLVGGKIVYSYDKLFVIEQNEKKMEIIYF
ncbi:MAG: DUF2194 domain-containing protein [Fervidobacterium sp.]|nr:DUF2194 domain-containing protein [Fervidobacterium sp.]